MPLAYVRSGQLPIEKDGRLAAALRVLAGVLRGPADIVFGQAGHSAALGREKLQWAGPPERGQPFSQERPRQEVCLAP